MGQVPLRSSGGVGPVFEDLAGDVSLEDAGDLTHGLAFGEASGHVVAGCLLVPHPGQHDAIQRRVGLAVPAPVQSVPGQVGFEAP